MQIQYSSQDIGKAKKFLTDLQDLTNKEIAIINDGLPCNDKSRDSIIVGMIAEEFGDNIFNHMGVVKLGK